MDQGWVLERLRERGMSLRGLARQLGSDISVVSRLLSGERRVQLSEIEPIARELGASVEETGARLGLAASLATFFIGQEADAPDGEVAGAPELQALRQEIALLRDELRDARRE